MTFAQCAAEYIRTHQAGWKGKSTSPSGRGRSRGTPNPSSGGLPVASIDTGLVLKVLRPIWETKTKTAADVRSRIELILSWAKIHGYRNGENPARWRVISTTRYQSRLRLPRSPISPRCPMTNCLDLWLCCA